MKKSLHWLVLSLTLVVIGVAAFAYKVSVLGYPLGPMQEEALWTVQARIKLLPQDGPVKLELQLPHKVPGFARLDESFVSKGFGRTVAEDELSRVSRWTIRRLREQRTLYYRAQYSADSQQAGWTDQPGFPDPPQLEEPFDSALTTIVEDIRSRSADIESFALHVLKVLGGDALDENSALFVKQITGPESRVRIARQILAGARIPTEMMHGIRLEDDQRHATREPWLAVHNGKRWLYFNPLTGNRGLPKDVLLWWRGDRDVAEVTGAEIDDVRLSVRRADVDSLDLAGQRAVSGESMFANVSLLNLPVETQAVYGVLLMVPLGAFIIVVLRNIIGIKTFGTFMPVLIALAFRETQLLAGVIMFTIVVAAGLLIRFYLEHLRLLLVPRLASVLTIVVLLMTVTTLLSQSLGIEAGLSITLFPMVIMAMTIERMCIVWEERGPAEAVRDGLGSLAVAAAAYLVMGIESVRHLTFVFPELLLALLGVTIMLGRYTGYRLSELGRFRKLLDFSGSGSSGVG